jgi:hypothetical protein
MVTDPGRPQTWREFRRTLTPAMRVRLTLVLLALVLVIPGAVAIGIGLAWVLGA